MTNGATTMDCQRTKLQPNAVVIRANITYHTSTSLSEWASGTRSTSVVRGKWMLAWICHFRLGMDQTKIAQMCFYVSGSSANYAWNSADADDETKLIADEIYTRAFDECNRGEA